MTAPNSIADLIRVAHALRADAATLRVAAGLLGLAGPEVTPREPGPSPVPGRRPTGPAAPAAPSSSTVDTPAQVRPAGQDPRPARDFRLTRTEPANTGPPRPIRASVFDLLPAKPPAPAAPEPLFEPWHERAVLSALAAVDRPGREVDIDVLVDRAARREPLGEVPRRPEPTTRLGVRLLVDHGPSMSPFRRDLRLLAAALGRVAGSDAIEVLAVRDGLTEVIPLSTEDDEPRPYPASVAARPILVATDLGIGGTPGIRPADWARLMREVREAGAPLVALVPYPPARWPDWADSLTVVRWDRPTNAGHARRAARRAGRLR